MLRREFFKLSGLGVLALPMLKLNQFGAGELGPRESTLWIHGSPYLGHSDHCQNFRGLTHEQIWKEIVHFRTAEPWRQAILFGL